MSVDKKYKGGSRHYNPYPTLLPLHLNFWLLTLYVITLPSNHYCSKLLSTFQLIHNMIYLIMQALCNTNPNAALWYLTICVTHPWLSTASSCCGCRELFSPCTDKCQSLKTWGLSGLWRRHPSWDQPSWSGPVPSWVDSNRRKPGHPSTGSPASTRAGCQNSKI